MTGYSPAQLINEIRLQKAYELLLSGDIGKVDDVCKRVGYEKASYSPGNSMSDLASAQLSFLASTS
jgi:AraC-like DNA-binding protein